MSTSFAPARFAPARFAIVIPARFASTRFPGKPLAPLTGAHGTVRPLVERSWLTAQAVPGCAGVWIATDDTRIVDAVHGFGGQVVMTSPDCRNGTERCAEAWATLRAQGTEIDIMVNLQGDAPLTPAHIVEGLVTAMAAEPPMTEGGCGMATAALRCTASTWAHLKADADAGRVGGTTVVADRHGRALYFSKQLIPYIPAAAQAHAHEAIHLHLGLYAYRAEALAAYAQAGPCALEDLEGLEQLRLLDAGLPVRVVGFDPLAWDCIELNNPGDRPAIEAALAARGID